MVDSIVGLKYFNVYGPNEEHKGSMRSVVGKAYEQTKDWGNDTFRAIIPIMRTENRCVISSMLRCRWHDSLAHRKRQGECVI